jgi:hypothetical protein
MSTNDVPGAKAINGDQLHVGCWAEHDDGSLIFVEGTEGVDVVYSLFDMSHNPILEYRDMMPRVSFERTYSWDPKDPYYKDRKGGKSKQEKWTWHDKTPFPWKDRIIKNGGQDGLRYASVHDQLSAAARVAKSLRLRALEVAEDRFNGRTDEERLRATVTASGIFGKLKRAINELRR